MPGQRCPSGSSESRASVESRPSKAEAPQVEGVTGLNNPRSHFGHGRWIRTGMRVSAATTCGPNKPNRVDGETQRVAMALRDLRQGDEVPDDPTLETITHNVIGTPGVGEDASAA